MAEVGLVYDTGFSEHQTGPHPERPERLLWAADKLKELGLWAECFLIPPRLATPEEVALFHDPAYITSVERFSRSGGGMFSLDTAGSAGTYQAALLAAGGVLEAIAVAFSRRTASAFCLVRPPGHHAKRAAGKGFCFFNNVAIGALWARQRLGRERVAVVDWDVHHGDGTQEAFYADPGVLYFSFHQYPLYPGTGRNEEVGEGAGKGYTINVPLPPGGSDEEYLLAADMLLVPLLAAYRPQLILVSAGYDAHFADELGNMRLTARGFQVLTERVQTVATLSDAPLVLVLEGGYSPRGMGEGVAATVAALLGRRISWEITPTTESYGVRPQVKDLLEKSRKFLSQFWGEVFT